MASNPNQTTYNTTMGKKKKKTYHSYQRNGELRPPQNRGAVASSKVKARCAVAEQWVEVGHIGSIARHNAKVHYNQY